MALPVKNLNEKFEGEIEYRKKRWGIPFVLPGDHVQFLLKRKGRGLSLEVVKIEKSESYPDIKLSKPFCNVYGICGGCRAQHLDYEEHIRFKIQPVIDKMQAHFGIVSTFLAPPSISSYRNRMDFAVDGGYTGLRPAMEHDRFIDIETCPIQKEAANDVLFLFRNLIKEFNNLYYRRIDGSGVLKYITIRSGITTLAILTVAEEKKEDPELKKFIELFIQKASHVISSLVICYTERQSDLSVVPGGEVLFGNGTYKEAMCGMEFDVPYDSFFQPNAEAFGNLFTKAMDFIEKERWLDNKKNLSLIDLYCGAGVLSSIFIKRFKGCISVIKGSDFVSSSVNLAGLNLTAAGFPGKFEFFAADLSRDSIQLESDVMIIDPPRSGMSARLVAEVVQSATADFILYVSCNPDSQIRDLELLIHNYQPVHAIIADCFPGTAHREQIVILKRKQ